MAREQIDTQIFELETANKEAGGWRAV